MQYFRTVGSNSAAAQPTSYLLISSKAATEGFVQTYNLFKNKVMFYEQTNVKGVTQLKQVYLRGMSHFSNTHIRQLRQSFPTAMHSEGP